MEKSACEKKIVGKKTAWHDCMESKDKNAMTHSPVFADAKKNGWKQTETKAVCIKCTLTLY